MEFYIDSKGPLPCWDNDRVEFYIDSKGPVPCWEDDRVEFYIDSKGLQLKESLSPSPSSFCC